MRWAEPTTPVRCARVADVLADLDADPGPFTVHAALMASPEHRAEILDTGFTEVGLGVVRVTVRCGCVPSGRRRRAAGRGGDPDARVPRRVDAPL